MEEGMSPTTFLPDDLVFEVLARLPARSLCVCMCVSRSWHRLISDPANRPRLTQTMSGLFFSHPDYTRWPPLFFVGFSSPPPPVDPVFSFLPHPDIELLDSSNGLFLFLCSLTPRFLRHPQSASPRPRFYVVCNPTTEEWMSLPQPSNAPGLRSYSDELMANTNTTSAALGFDPAVSSHFHVFQLVEKEVECIFELDAVEIYSSETGKWWVLSKTQSKCGFAGSMTYFNGFLHFTNFYGRVVSVDTTGQTWRVTTVVEDSKDLYAHNVVGHSRGRLLYVHDSTENDALTIYALQDDKEWILKQRVSKLDLFGPEGSRDKWSYIRNYMVAAFHPDGDLIIFCDRPRKRLVSYDMNHRHVHVICTLKEVPDDHRPFKPYVPLYSGPLASSKAVK